MNQHLSHSWSNQRLNFTAELFGDVPTNWSCIWYCNAHWCTSRCCDPWLMIVVCCTCYTSLVLVCASFILKIDAIFIMRITVNWKTSQEGTHHTPIPGLPFLHLTRNAHLETGCIQRQQCYANCRSSGEFLLLVWPRWCFVSLHRHALSSELKLLPELQLLVVEDGARTVAGSIQQDEM